MWYHLLSGIYTLSPRVERVGHVRRLDRRAEHALLQDTSQSGSRKASVCGAAQRGITPASSVDRRDAAAGTNRA